MKIVNKPIDVIAYFDAGLGKGYTGVSEKQFPLPKRIRVLEEAEPVTVNIDKIITAEESRICGVPTIVYLCQSEIDGVAKRYELKYEIGAYRWRLYKI